nr:PUA domain-containing protein [Methanomicrobium sp. W14]
MKRVRTIADYQFGKGVGEGLFPEECDFKLSSTKRIRYVLLGEDRLATLRAGDGRLTLSLNGAKRLFDCLGAPDYRVIIKDEVREFIAQGKNAMAKHVVSADGQIRSGDEVIVCDEEGLLLATGNALLSGEEMAAFNYGVAVQIRKGS